MHCLKEKVYSRIINIHKNRDKASRTETDFYKCIMYKMPADGISDNR